MLTFTIPALALILFAVFIAGMAFGIWLILNKIK